MNCPKCNTPAEPVTIEIDIGVGIQTHLCGCDCPLCGRLGCCETCGAWEGEPHRAWCGEAPGN